MKDNHPTAKFYEIMRQSMEKAREQAAVPSPRDILKREYNDAQKRPRNLALEKWGPVIEAQIQRDLDCGHENSQPKKDGPDMDV